MNRESLLARIILNFILIVIGMAFGYYWGEIHWLGHLFGH